METTKSRSRRLKIYLLGVGLSWMTLTALATRNDFNVAIQGFAARMVDGLKKVDPFFLLQTFIHTFLGDNVQNEVGLRVKPKPLPKPLDVPLTIKALPSPFLTIPKGLGDPAPGDGTKRTSPITRPSTISSFLSKDRTKPGDAPSNDFAHPMKIIDRTPMPVRQPESISKPIPPGIAGFITRIFRAVGATAFAVWRGGWSAWFAALISLAIGFTIISSALSDEKVNLGTLIHPANVLLMLFASFALSALICWLLKWIMVGLLQFFGASLTIVVFLSPMILVIESIRTVVTTAVAKGREIRELSREDS